MQSSSFPSLILCLNDLSSLSLLSAVLFLTSPLPFYAGGCMGKQRAPYTLFVACCLVSAV